MALNRREWFIAALGTSFALPLQACVAQSGERYFTPEAFGATGNGITDDYEAFRRLVVALNSVRGGIVRLAPRRTYLLDRIITSSAASGDLTFNQCDGLTIDGNGASIAVKGDFNRTVASTRSLAGLVFVDCRNVALRNLELVGNVHRTSRLLTLTETSSHGLVFESCSDVTIDAVTVRHFASDGMYIRQSKFKNAAGVQLASRRFTVRNSRFLFNARQGVSVVQLRGGLFENCDFSYTGYVDAGGKSGPYGSHAPSAGVDVEPNQTPRSAKPVDVLTGDLVFRRSRMVGNRGTTLVACKYSLGQRYIERVRLEACRLECEDSSPSRYGFIFDAADGEVRDCTLQMGNRTAFIGWRRHSDASWRFTGNTVTGANVGPRHALAYVRRSLGTIIVENNRFFADAAPPHGAAARPWLLVVDNPNAIVRNNQLELG
jgi:hypothetical protein